MDARQKNEIMAAASEFMAAHAMKGAEFARRAGVNESYFSVASRGTYTFQNTEIKDSFFRKVASTAGYSIARTYWRHVATEQYLELVSKLVEAHEHKYLNTLIGATGCGKSYSVERYRRLHPTEVIVVTVNNTDDVHSIIACIADQLSIALPVRRGAKLRALAKGIKEAAQNGRKLLLIIDEAENMKAPGIKACKAIYDLVVKPGYSGLVLIGTNELVRNIDRFERYGQDGMAQFKRRITAGITNLPTIDLVDEIDKFMEEADITDKGLRSLLLLQCPNYGVLHDYLERAIRIADEEGQSITEDLFRTIYNIKTTNR